MPMQGAVDTLKAKPKFPKERTEHGTVTQTVGSTAASGQSLITMSNTAGIQNGYIVQAYSNNSGSIVNIGNTTPITSGGSGILGFDQVGPSVVNVQGTLITLSAAITGAVNAGQQLVFSKPFKYKPNTFANTYNANTYMVTTKRIANANSIAANSVTHVGWNYVTPGTGYIKAVNIKTAGNQYGTSTSGYLNITANTQYPGGSGANVYFTTNANGAIVSTTVNVGGVGFVLTPTVTAPFVGNTQTGAVNAVFTVVMGGRANRIQVETLSALSSPSANDPTSGGIWFPGV